MNFLKSPRLLRTLSAIAMLFGLLTIYSGGRTLWGDDATRQAAGNIVSFVLWFNFLAGFAYVAAGFGLWMEKPWAAWLSLLITVGTLLVFAGLGAHILAGNPYEIRTLAAMVLRSGFWILVTAVAHLRYRQ